MAKPQPVHSQAAPVEPVYNSLRAYPVGHDVSPGMVRQDEERTGLAGQYVSCPFNVTVGLEVPLSTQPVVVGVAFTGCTFKKADPEFPTPPPQPVIVTGESTTSVLGVTYCSVRLPEQFPADGREHWQSNAPQLTVWLAWSWSAPAPEHEPGLTTLQPVGAGQSGSSRSVAPSGQQRSLVLRSAAILLGGAQSAVQRSALPIGRSSVHGSPSSHEIRQLVDGSQVSPPSTTLLPQLGEQSESLFALAFAGQQPSPFLAATTGMLVHLTLHWAMLPVCTSVVHGSPSSHEVGQELEGSQISPSSTVPLPQFAEQSESVTLVQFAGQQRSPLAQAVIGAVVHSASHVWALPSKRGARHGSGDVQLALVGQLPSHVSPLSICPLPHTFAAIRPAGDPAFAAAVPPTCDPAFAAGALLPLTGGAGAGAAALAIVPRLPDPGAFEPSAAASCVPGVIAVSVA